MPVFTYEGKWFGSKEKDGTLVLKSLVDDNFSIKLDGTLERLGAKTYKIKSDGKQNVISPEKILLPQWCDEVGSILKSTNFGYIVIFRNNGKNYLYCPDSQQYLINPNGIPYFIYKDSYNDIHIKKGDELEVIYNPYDNKFRIPMGYNNYPKVKQQAEAFISELTGKNSNSNSQMAAANVAVAEEFKRIMKRINEAQKLNYRDIFD